MLLKDGSEEDEDSDCGCFGGAGMIAVAPPKFGEPSLRSAAPANEW